MAPVIQQLTRIPRAAAAACRVNCHRPTGGAEDRTGRQLQKLQKQMIFAENRARKLNGRIQMSHPRIRFKFAEHTSLMNRHQGSVFYYSHQAQNRNSRNNFHRAGKTMEKNDSEGSSLLGDPFPPM